MSNAFFEQMVKEFDISPEIIEIYRSSHDKCKKYFLEVDKIAEYNQLKVLKTFKNNRISTIHFSQTDGYGYNDIGREMLDKAFAEVFGTEDALVRHNIISGTHALSLCFFAVLRPGDTLVSVTGKPYDTLAEVIGLSVSTGNGSLKDFGINYKQVELTDGRVDKNNIMSTIDDKTKAVLIQKSKGYDWRESLTNYGIGEIITLIKSKYPDIVCIVDNCYGEFVEITEPGNHGADLIAGSLIKNPGGGIAQTGGYIAGRSKYVELAAYKLNSVGLGKECGATLGFNRSMFMGLFLAPHVVSQAVKASIFCSQLLLDAGYEVCPLPSEQRTDIIQAIKLGNAAKIIAFCQGIQLASPIDSFVTPVPCAMPGYQNEVIMAAGTFTQGASIEISADAPIREPYAVYIQGGLTYESAEIAILNAYNNLLKIDEN